MREPTIEKGFQNIVRYIYIAFELVTLLVATCERVSESINKVLVQLFIFALLHKLVKQSISVVWRYHFGAKFNSDVYASILTCYSFMSDGILCSHHVLTYVNNFIFTFRKIN